MKTPRPYTGDFDLSPEVFEYLENLLANDPVMASIEAARKIATIDLDNLAAQLARDEADRRELWGNKYPKILGRKPEKENKKGNVAVPEAVVPPVKPEKNRVGRPRKEKRLVGTP